MIQYEHSPNPLADRLGIQLDVYRMSRENHYKDAPPAFRALVELLDELAQDITRDASNLTVPEHLPDEIARAEEVPWTGILETAKQSGFEQELIESLEVVLAEDALERLRDAPRRCLVLVEFILATPVGTSTGRFLGRLGRCYLSGLFPECIILCRAVLENAVAERFGREGVPIPATEAGRSPMAVRLQAAEMFGWISPGGHDLVRTVWLRGNKAVHDDPEATTEVLGTMKATVTVLRELYSDV